jgi:hypothetical protein
MAVNSIIYPSAKIKIHISKEVKNHFLFEIIEKISLNFKNIEIETLDYDFSNTEPTMWRYKPIFDKQSDVVLCRDIDSLPNEDEIKATFFFLQNSNFYVQTLRTHTNHVIPATIMLAGLCGFRPKKIDFINNISFDTYYNHFKNAGWGLDQNSLINLFVRDPNWTRNRFLDSPISTEFHNVGGPLIQCESLNQNFYRNKIELDISSELLNFLNRNTKWSGEPIDIRGDKLKEFFEIELDEIKIMKKTISECSENLQKFYLGNV